MNQTFFCIHIFKDCKKSANSTHTKVLFVLFVDFFLVFFSYVFHTQRYHQSHFSVIDFTITDVGEFFLFEFSNTYLRFFFSMLKILNQISFVFSNIPVKKFTCFFVVGDDLIYKHYLIEEKSKFLGEKRRISDLKKICHCIFVGTSEN